MYIAFVIFYTKRTGPHGNDVHVYGQVQVVAAYEIESVACAVYAHNFGARPATRRAVPSPPRPVCVGQIIAN